MAEFNDIPVIPIYRPPRTCARCPNVLSMYNKADLCNACQLRERKAFLSRIPDPKPKTLPPVTHPSPKLVPPKLQPVPITNSKPNTETSMDVLASRTIRMEDMPVITKRTSVGRLGMLWEKVRDLKPGFVEVVDNRDDEHAKKTRDQIRKKARSAGMSLESRRDGATLYLWIAAKDKAA